MNNYKDKISKCIRSKWLYLSKNYQDQFIDDLYLNANEYVISNIASDLLKKDDLELFRDSFLSAPEIFDADEFLSMKIKDYNKKFDLYFEKWLDWFSKNL